MSEKIWVGPELVRDFFAHGEGDFEKLKELIAAPAIASVADSEYQHQGVLITYPLYLDSDELVDSILKAVNESGYHITKTRSRKITASLMIMPGERWKDFSEYYDYRQIKRTLKAMNPDA